VIDLDSQREHLAAGEFAPYQGRLNRGKALIRNGGGVSVQLPPHPLHVVGHIVAPEL